MGMGYPEVEGGFSLAINCELELDDVEDTDECIAFTERLYERIENFFDDKDIKLKEPEGEEECWRYQTDDIIIGFDFDYDYEMVVLISTRWTNGWTHEMIDLTNEFVRYLVGNYKQVSLIRGPFKTEVINHNIDFLSFFKDKSAAEIDTESDYDFRTTVESNVRMHVIHYLSDFFTEYKVIPKKLEDKAVEIAMETISTEGEYALISVSDIKYACNKAVSELIEEE